MGNLFAGPHIWIVLAIVILLFGATRLPALAKSLGQSTKIFKNEIKSDKDDTTAESRSADTTSAAETKASDKK
ncbi:MAG TPA: twin-arginine translocase TatA/TatE family subunit [Pseudolysinimonas sp.]|nr:twin-arginine translocase TatA/TatE family subunit [Pseudolysinimonas sp.]